MKAHAGNLLAVVNGEPTFASGRCTWCGSIPFTDAMRLLSTSGTSWSIADWKYGWPHKIYLGNGKFYAEHLRDVSDEELVQFNAKLKPLSGIFYVRESEQPEDLFFGAPSPNHTPFGIVP